MEHPHLFDQITAIPRAAALRVLDLARRRPGADEVQMIPESVRGGNILYHWQHAYLSRAAGSPRPVVRTSHMNAWLEEMPILSTLTTSPDEVTLLDRRDLDIHHRYGRDFSRSDNAEFCRWLVASSPSFRRRLDAARLRTDEATCVINVRRGDYYSVDEHRDRFGMDILGHVAEALSLIAEAGRPVEDLLVVTDDRPWCEEHLAGGGITGLRFVEDRADLFDDLATLAVSRTLVLANSTFSYWGSHLAAAGDPEHLAIAPSHHEIVSSGARVTDMFDPTWPRTSYRPFRP